MIPPLPRLLGAHRKAQGQDHTQTRHPGKNVGVAVQGEHTYAHLYRSGSDPGVARRKELQNGKPHVTEEVGRKHVNADKRCQRRAAGKNGGGKASPLPSPWRPGQDQQKDGKAHHQVHKGNEGEAA